MKEYKLVTHTFGSAGALFELQMKSAVTGQWFGMKTSSRLDEVEKFVFEHITADDKFSRETCKHTDEA